MAVHFTPFTTASLFCRPYTAEFNCNLYPHWVVPYVGQCLLVSFVAPILSCSLDYVFTISYDLGGWYIGLYTFMMAEAY